MDFDKPKVYGDTFISDGLVYILMVLVAVMRMRVLVRDDGR